MVAVVVVVADVGGGEEGEHGEVERREETVAGYRVHDNRGERDSAR